MQVCVYVCCVPLSLSVCVWGECSLRCVVIYCIRVPDFTNVMRHTPQQSQRPQLLNSSRLRRPRLRLLRLSLLMHMQSFEYFACQPYECDIVLSTAVLKRERERGRDTMYV